MALVVNPISEMYHPELLIPNNVPSDRRIIMDPTLGRPCVDFRGVDFAGKGQHTTNNTIINRVDGKAHTRVYSNTTMLSDHQTPTGAWAIGRNTYTTSSTSGAWAGPTSFSEAISGLTELTFICQAWVKYTTSDNNYMQIMRQSAAGVDTSFTFTSEATGISFRARIRESYYGDYYIEQYDAIPSDEWVNVVCIWPGGNTFTTYINGVEYTADSTENSGTVTKTADNRNHNVTFLRWDAWSCGGFCSFGGLIGKAIPEDKARDISTDITNLFVVR